MLAKLDIAINFFVAPLYEATFFDCRLRPHTMRSAQPFGYFIQRGRRAGEDKTRVSLDDGLCQQALLAGVSIHYKSRISPTNADIIATGPASAHGLAKEMTFLTDAPDTVWVLFDMKYAPGGYAYLFVQNGMATFGCAITRHLNAINSYFDAALLRIKTIFPFPIREEQKGYSFMDFRLKSSAIDHDKLYIGEAGGFQDYLFGLGLRYAFMTGAFAAMSLIQQKSYDDLWKEDLGCSQEISLVNRYLYERGGNFGLSTFIRRAEKRDLKQYLALWQTASPWKKALLPLIKWAWQEKGSCRHSLPHHWCRDRKQQKRG